MNICFMVLSYAKNGNEEINTLYQIIGLDVADISMLETKVK